MIVARKLLLGLSVFVSFAFTSFAASAIDEAERQFRTKHNLEPSVLLKFLDEKGSDINLAEFSRKYDSGAEFSKALAKSAKGEDTRIFQLLAQQTAEQIAREKEAARARNAKLQQLAGKPFPAFKLLDADDKSVSNQDLLGCLTLVNFFFAECAPCILETPILNEFLGHRKDVRMLAITFDDKATVEKYRQKYKFAWQILVDARTFIGQVGVRAYPSFLLLDAEGVVRAVAIASTSPNAKGEYKPGSLDRKWLDDWINGVLEAKLVK